MIPLIEFVRSAVRIMNPKFDGIELLPLIETAKADLKRAGVKKIDDSDPSVRIAIKFYAQANFGFNEDAEEYMKRYRELRDSMALSGDDENENAI